MRMTYCHNGIGTITLLNGRRQVHFRPGLGSECPVVVSNPEALLHHNQSMTVSEHETAFTVGGHFSHF